MPIPPQVTSAANLADAAGADTSPSSGGTPKQVLKHLLADPNWWEGLSEHQRADLTQKAESLKELSPACDCLGLDLLKNGPYYVHLGHAATKEKLRENFEGKLKVSGPALRLVCVRFTGKEGKTMEDCPIAKWIVRRSSPQEKFVVVTKQRYGHSCEYTWVVVAILQWDGLGQDLADRTYRDIKTLISGEDGTPRKCATNKRKNCGCQGTGGASKSFGCSKKM